MTVGIPGLKAKRNVEIKGVGKKFSGLYWCTSVRHSIGGSGYSCELKLKRNAVGDAGGGGTEATGGDVNDQAGPDEPQEEAPAMITINADTGEAS